MQEQAHRPADDTNRWKTWQHNRCLTMFLDVRPLIVVSVLLSATAAASDEPLVSPRIVGGRDANPGRLPYFTQIIIEDSEGDSHRCSGVLIHSDIVLTAGHCWNEDNTASMTVFVNTTSRSLDDGIEIDVDSWRRPPDFDIELLQNDVLVLKLHDQVMNVDAFLPELNRDRNVPVEDTDLTVIGLGRLEDDGDFPDVLQVVELAVIDSDVCADQFIEGAVNGMAQICASAPGKGSCSGDSGGPVVIARDELPDLLIGLVSFGSGCAREGASSVNTRFSYYYEWIMTQTCELSDDPPTERCNELLQTETPSPSMAPISAPIEDPSMSESPTSALPTAVSAPTTATSVEGTSAASDRYSAAVSKLLVLLGGALLL